MKSLIVFIIIATFSLLSVSFAACPYDSNCLNNPYGAGSPYKADADKRLVNGQFGSI